MIKVDNNFVILILTIVFLVGIYTINKSEKKYSKYIYIFVISTIVLFTTYMWELYIHEEYKLQNDPKIKELKEKVQPLISKEKKYTGILSRINDRDVISEISLYKGDKSYTINKHKIYICLLDENDQYYNDMMLLFVFLHEISHVLCNSIGHTDEFNEIFDALLQEAVKNNIYDPSYQPIKDYCQY